MTDETTDKGSEGRFVRIENTLDAVREDVTGLSVAVGRIESALIEKDRALVTALTSQRLQVKETADRLEMRLDKLNELRGEVITDRARFVPRDVFDAEMKPLQDFKSKALGFGALVALISGVVGAFIQKLVA